MIYWDLFIGFLKVGCFAFGGAYGAIPLIRDVVFSYGWLSEEVLMDMIAVGERCGARWVSAGARSKKGGHPHHPLYLRKDSPLDDFDVKAYLGLIDHG